MLSIEQLAARENTATITLRGTETTVRGLTLADRAVIEDIYLLPDRPRPDDEGNTAPPDEVAYKRAFNRCIAERMAATAAVALDWKTKDGKTWGEVRQETGHAKRFLANCGEEFVEIDLSRGELEAVLSAVERIERRGFAETARKNS